MSAVAGPVDGEAGFPLKIYDFPRGPYPTRVRIALAEKNLQSRVEFVMVDLRKGEHKDPGSSRIKTTPERFRCLSLRMERALPSAPPSRSIWMRLSAVRF